MWALTVYRFGQLASGTPSSLRRVSALVYACLHTPVEVITGISIPRRTSIGPGLRIYHFGPIVVHPDARIGANCTLAHGVTIGIREDGRAPIIEDDVVFGAYAQVLGGVRVGRGAKIGAMSVVLKDVPEGAAVAGIPARIVGTHAAAPIESAR